MMSGDTKISYEDYNKFLKLSSSITALLDKIGLRSASNQMDEFLDSIAAEIESHLGE